MKNLILTAVLAVAFSFGAFAQTTTPARDTIPTEQKSQKKDMYVMKDSKMWAIKQGQKTEMAQEVTLSNGTQVHTDGTVKTSDGETIQLKEGQYIDVDGNIGDWKEDTSA